jgi:hypothetical protein
VESWKEVREIFFRSEPNIGCRPIDSAAGLAKVMDQFKDGNIWGFGRDFVRFENGKREKAELAIWPFAAVVQLETEA